MPSKATRAHARKVYGDLVEESYAVRALFIACDAAVCSHDPHLVRILTMQTRALVAQRDHMQTLIVDMAVLERQHPALFTRDIAALWQDFTEAVDGLAAVTLMADSVQEWIDVRERINMLFTVDLAPPEESEVGLQAGQGVSVPDPDASFVCEEPLRSQLLAAGTMTNEISLGQKTIMVYIQENMVTPFKAFTGERDDESLKELLSRLDLVHRAPVSQVPYKMKVEALFRCLDGKAKQSVVGYFGAETRLSYLKLWDRLFKLYCNRGRDLARQINLINGAAPKSTSSADMIDYMNVLSNASVQLDMLKHSAPQIAALLWNSLLHTVPDYVLRYCELRVLRFDEDFGSDVSSWHSVNGMAKFDGFYAYVLSRTTAESSAKTAATVFRAQAVLDTVKPESTKPSSSKKEDTRKRAVAHVSGAETPQIAKKPRVDTNPTPPTTGPRPHLGNQIICFLCKDVAHPWRECIMMIDGREALFANESRCRKCSAQDHITSECHGASRCEHCADPNDPVKGSSHHTALCYKAFGRPQSSTRGRGGGRGGRRGRGGAVAVAVMHMHPKAGQQTYGQQQLPPPAPTPRLRTIKQLIHPMPTPILSLKGLIMVASKGLGTIVDAASSIIATRGTGLMLREAGGVRDPRTLIPT